MVIIIFLYYHSNIVPKITTDLKITIHILGSNKSYVYFM